jgi:transposase
MRGNDTSDGSLFSYFTLESRIPPDHPLRGIRAMVDPILQKLSPDFDRMYAHEGRPSIPPERLLRAQLIQILFSIRSERLLMQQLDYNLLFRWFVGLGIDEAVWVPTVFTKNRERLMESQIAARFFDEVLALARNADLLSSEHFTIDGTFIEAWASHKSFRRKDGSDDPPEGGGRNKTVDFKGEKRSNETHESKTDPDSRLMCKRGETSKLVHHGHAMTENRNGLVVDTEVTVATGRAEVEAAEILLGRRRTQGIRGTVGADKAYDNARFLKAARESNLTPHVTQNISKTHVSYVDGRTTRHAGYEVSQRKRKLIEEVFGWMKTVGLLRKTRHRGTQLVDWMFRFAAGAYNLIRIRKLLASAA